MAHEVNKPPTPPKDEITTSADTADSSSAKPKRPERRTTRTGEHSDQAESGDHLSRPVTEETVPDFTHWNFHNSDISGLARTYKPARGFEENGWNPNGSYDTLLRGALRDNEVLAEEFKDVTNSLEIKAESDWLSVTSPEEYGALNLGYQIHPPTEEDPRWKMFRTSR